MHRRYLRTALFSTCLVLLITLCGTLWNSYFPRLENGSSFSGVNASYGVSLTGWVELEPGRWQYSVSDLPTGQTFVLCIAGQSRTLPPDGMEPLAEMDEFFVLEEQSSSFTLSRSSTPAAWLLPIETAWDWINLRTNLQLVALVAFVSMGAGILALFCFKPQQELGCFLFYITVMFLWGLTVSLAPVPTSPGQSLLNRLYFPFAIIIPLWLCASLTHVSLPKRYWGLCAAALLGFVYLSTYTPGVVRNLIMAGGMYAIILFLSYQLAKGEQSAWYLMAGHLPTMGLRLLVLLLPLGSLGFVESFAFYMVRCARIYDIPFVLGCLVYVCRRFALQFDRAEQLTLELEDRVARRTQALQNETDARKSMMLNIFHDLRSPLFVVSSGLDTLSAAPESLPTLLPILQQRVDFIRSLTEDLFLAAKLEQKQIILNEDRLMLNEVSAAVCEGCQTEAQQKGIQLLVELPTVLPVWGDAMRLEQIVQNLVTNALHYTPAGGTVRVEGSISAQDVLLCVTDTGCGIAPEDQPAVFDRYFHTTTNTKHDSTGLGLTIAQELAHLHHGEITLQSEVGKGSRFTLRLPLLQLD